MRRCAALLAAVTIASGLLALPAHASSVEELRPINLRVAGGETWHADNDFRLDWDYLASHDPDEPIVAIHYLVRDSSGDVVLPATKVSSWGAEKAEHIHVPSRPGRYTAEVWLQTGAGEGPRVSASLFFDDTRPDAPRTLDPAAWISGARPAALQIEPAVGPHPVSGIRGYAVSVDRDPGGSPCAGPDRCNEGETDLRPQIDGNMIWLGVLPEGVNVAHVVAISGSGMRSAVEHLTLRVDATRPDVILAGLPSGWADDPVRVLATASDPLSGVSPAGPAGPFTAIAVDGGVPTVSAGPSVTATVTGDGAHSIAFYARDAVGNVGDGQAGSPSPATAVVRIDGTPPRVSFVDSRDPSEPELIEAAVADQLSGPSAIRGSISVRAAGTHRQFEPIPTSVSEGKLIARWDSDAYPAGSYEFRATGYDAAGNAGCSDRRVDGARMVLANPLKVASAIQFGFEQFERRRATRSAPYGHRVRVGGQLTSISGSPLDGLRVDLIEKFDAGSGTTQRTTSVLTGEDGAFLARLAPGPSRRIEARFAGNRVLSRAGSREVRLAVPATVRLRASARTASIGGAPIVFSGRIGLLGATIPRSGRSIDLQFRLPGAPWSEFRTIQTDRQGRFRYAYAFSDDDSRGVRFQFRAYAPAQEGWPYEPAASRPVAVTGR